ncbi:MAG TPA: TonB family protein [Nitrososphaera sp.]|nr:TonB family protein [Nitrososphaera sp.]
MVLRADDGSILSKEKYDYEFDEFGNWKKMTSSVGVYESGKLSYEPVELTYRTISYYYNEAIDKVAKSLSKSNDSSGSAPRAEPRPTKPAAATPVRGSTTEPKIAIKDEATSSRVEPKVKNGEINGETRDAASVAAAPRDEAALKNSHTGTTVAAPSGSSNKAIPIQYVPEEVLRSAVVELPRPEYPQAAMLARVEGNVEVRVLVDEQGNVMSARAMSGSPLLIDAAEAAARKARFSKAKLSLDSARVYSVIKYTFTIPASEVSSTRSTNDSSAEHKNVKLEAGTPVSKIDKQSKGIVKPEGSSAAEQSPPISSSDAATTFYKKGLSYLTLGRHAEAVDALKQAIQADPNNAVAYEKLGLAYSGLHQYKDTVAVLKMAIRIQPEVVDAEAYYQLGQAYLALGKHSDALEALKHALYITRAQAIDPDGAKVQRFPSLEDIHYGLALTYHNMGRYSVAIKELQQVIAMNPKFAEAYYGLVLSYVALGDRKSAEKQQKILSSLNTALGEKAANALSPPSQILPPGVNTGRP